MVELTQAVPLQYWPEGQVDVVSLGEVVTQLLPFQYWPLPHEEEVVVITQAVPLQYWPLGQEVELVEVVLD